MAQKLPPEILQLIAKSLAPFDNEKDPKILPLDHLLFDSRPGCLHGTMASLCLVSRTFRDFTTPVLYSVPMTQKTAELVRTLVERPDLAQHVRYLHHDFWNNWYGVDRAALGPKFKKLQDEAYEYIERRVAEGEHGPLELGNDWHNPMDELRREREKEENDDMMNSIIISLCLNLEKLHVSSYYRSVLASIPPDSLLNLTTVTVSHGDTEGGLNFPDVFYLAKAAPNITTLVIYALAHVGNDEEDDFSSFPSFPKVTTLKLGRSIIGESAFPAIIRSFPHLEDFAYECGDATVSDCQGIYAQPLLDAVIAHVPRTLKALDVDMSDGFVWDVEDEDVYAWDERLAQLGERGLETLAVDMCTLFPVNEDEEDYPEDVLISRLPASLKTLRVSWYKDGSTTTVGERLSQTKASFLRLAEEASVRFPELKEVFFSRLGNGDAAPEIGEAFAAAGVAFSIERLPSF